LPGSQPNNSNPILQSDDNFAFNEKTPGAFAEEEAENHCLPKCHLKKLMS